VLPSYATAPLREHTKRADATGKRADGTEFPMGYTLSALLDANGHPSGLLLAFQDLT
jgi:hypothetical protein